MSDLTIDRSRTALLVMDFQTSIVGRVGAGASRLLETTASAVAAARRGGVPVIYVVVGFRPGFPEISPNNKSFSTLKAGSGLSTEIDARVAPQPEEVVITKRRVSAFHGTELDMVLRAHGVDTLVMAGITTSGVVLSTLRHAADADYRIVVLRDCCADTDPVVHATLLDKVFPRQADVTMAAELLPLIAG